MPRHPVTRCRRLASPPDARRNDSVNAVQPRSGAPSGTHVGVFARAQVEVALFEQPEVVQRLSGTAASVSSRSEERIRLDLKDRLASSDGGRSSLETGAPGNRETTDG